MVSVKQSIISDDTVGCVFSNFSTIRTVKSFIRQFSENWFRQGKEYFKIIGAFLYTKQKC